MPADFEELILASGSPRRRQLLTEAGYRFRVVRPNDSAECGICSHETPPELVARLSYQKAQDVANHIDAGIVVACDTVAECCGRILGKPQDRNQARKMLHLLRRREHHVYSGLCLWRRPSGKRQVKVAITRLHMESLTDVQVEDYLDSGAWRGKAGAFGLQDQLGWLHIAAGSETNVVGLPMELLREMLDEI